MPLRAPFLALPSRLLRALAPLLPLAATGCADQEEPPPPPEITWQECKGPSAVECGTLVVPRNHEDPFGLTFEIPVVRRAATDPDQRIGSILFNPGGPGGSGVGFVQGAWILLPPAVRDRFDLVGFDPRGQVASTPGIDCRYDVGRFAAQDPTPDSEAEHAAFLEESKEYATSCKDESGGLLGVVSTAAVVRDMDLLRQALGDEEISYVGFSYGTFIGEMYAEAFPDRVRAMVLDGVVDPSATAEELIEGQALGFEEELGAFFEQCSEDVQCALHAGGDPAAAYDAVQAAVEAEPLPAPPGGQRSLGPGELSYGVAAALYRPSGWSRLASALAEAQAGDGSGLLSLADGYLGRREDGTYGNSIDVYYAVTSVDMPSARDPAAVAALAASMRGKRRASGPICRIPCSRPWCGRWGRGGRRVR